MSRVWRIHFVSARPPSSTANRTSSSPRPRPRASSSTYTSARYETVWPSETTRAKPSCRLPLRAVEADDAGSRRDQLVHELSGPSSRPVARRDEGVHRGTVDPRRDRRRARNRPREPLHPSILPAGGAPLRYRRSYAPGRDHADGRRPARRDGPVREGERADRPLGVPPPLARLARALLALFFAMLLIARIPSTLVAPAAGVLCGGILGNSLSAAWNGMEVPNPLVIDADHASSPSTSRTCGP